MKDIAKFEQALAGLTALVLDFDGVFTANTVYLNEHGEEFVRCSRGDGLGLVNLKARGFPIMVVSKERNRVVSARCAKLGLFCLQAVDEKPKVLGAELDKRGLAFEHVAYMGNDVNDVEVMKLCGVSIAVADAHESAMAVANFVTEKAGGQGAIREVTDVIERLIESGEIKTSGAD